MRAVSLSDQIVQDKIEKSFIPLKVTIPYGSKEVPIDWPAMANWRLVHLLMGGENCQGLTGCTVISTDLKREYANTGSAFVWEMFDSTAYDATKFAAMLDKGLERAAREQALLADPKLSEKERASQLGAFHKEVRDALAKEGQAFGRRKGFNDLHALQLFGLSGDLFAKPPAKKK